MRIIYTSTSRFGSREANFIQVSQMISAFRESGVKTFSVYKHPKGGEPAQADDFILFSHDSRLGHYCFLVYATVFTLVTSRKKRCDLIYTRSITIGAICSLFTKRRIIIELHSSFSNKLERYFANLAASRNTSFVCISESLSRYINSQVSNARCFVEPDAHSASISDGNQLSEYYEVWSDDYRPKIGYFGSLKPQKGEKIIRNLLQKCQHASFHIFTLNDLDIYYENLVEFDQLNHSDSLQKMHEMDFLLLTVVPQGDKRDISEFTSPLKLYEYAATGKVILASDVPVLREVVSDDTVMFCENDADKFLSAINQLSRNNSLRKSMSLSLLEFAEDNTWIKRANRILHKINLDSAEQMG